MADLRLAGSRTRPLGGYLKGLGILRVIARQVDMHARGRWQDGAFELSSPLDREALLTFFREQYAPSPVVSPWNGGSGFFPKDRSEPLEAIDGSSTGRLARFRETIKASRDVLQRRQLADKPSAKEKAGLLRELRGKLPDAALDWLDAAVILGGSDVAYPPLLGSGGNDGRFDFSNNYASAVATCVVDEDRARSAELLGAALFGDSVPLNPVSLAYLQRDASPVNSPSGPSDAIGNPWDLILALEGALTMCAGAARRHGWALESRLVAPFSVDATSVGFGSAAGAETAYAEVWLPVWQGYSTLGELELLIREARAQVGRRHARDGLDFARAAGELGVARGIEAFERYSILERAGQARLAVPVGRIEVAERPAVRALHALDPLLMPLRRRARDDRTPRAVRAAVDRLDERMFEFAARPDPACASAVLVALGDMESALARSAAWSTGAGLRPLAHAQARPWVEAVDDGSAEVDIAVAIASLAMGSVGSLDMRDYLHGTGPDARGSRVFDTNVRVSLPRAGDPIARLSAIHVRQHVDAAAAGDSGRFGFRYGRSADGAARRAFALGRLDEQRIVDLAAGLCLLDFRDGFPRLRSRVQDMPCPALDALTLAWEGEVDVGLGPRPGWAARLQAGRVREVLGEGLIRLRTAGQAVSASAFELSADPPDGGRLVAALLTRTTRSERARIARSLGVSTPVGSPQEENAT